MDTNALIAEIDAELAKLTVARHALRSGDSIPKRRGRTAAILASLTSTCRRHDIDPQLYVTQLLVHLPSARTSELPAWQPDQWKLIISASRLLNL